MKFNLTIIIIIIILIYICCYFIFPPSVQILQTTITDFNFATLYTRQPIVISDYLQEKEELVNSWFKFNFIKDLNEDKKNYNDWVYNRYKYLFINANKNTEIIIYKASISSKPPNEDNQIIAIKLEKNQSLILPYRWKFFIDNNEDIQLWGINDLITSFVSFVF